jgi:HD-like signal output (HDOD) protein
MQPARSQEELRAIHACTQHMNSPNFHPPMLPDIAQRAMQLVRNPNCDIREVGKLIERDQLLAVRFLRAANSGLYRRGLPALSISAALTRIGLATARDLLIFASLEPYVFASQPFAKEMALLRKHSLAVSGACMFLAKYTRTPVEDAGLAGLVHDVGAAILLKHIADNLPSFSGLYSTGVGVAGVLSAAHAAAGARLAEAWSLPLLVRAVMRGHHDIVDSSPELLRLVAAADDLATSAGAGSGFEVTQNTNLRTLLRGAARVEDSVKQFADRVAEIASP